MASIAFPATFPSAIAGAIETILSQKHVEKTNLEWWRDFTLFSIVHFASGMTVGLLLKSFISNEYVLFGLTAIGALLGTKTMLSIFRSILEKQLLK